MSRNARVEEVHDDSDPDEVPPVDNSSLGPLLSPAEIPKLEPQLRPTQPAAEPQREIPKYFQCLYPVYFDKTRSRAEGRKVGTELAVENPLARDIADAVQLLGLHVALEPEKQHPKDWANPGRVRILLKGPDGRLAKPRIKNKHHLYILVAQYLKAHPTTEQSSFKLQLRGFPIPEKLPGPPAAPRGWKISKILPIHSPAYSGGGISDNPFKEAMAEMQNMQGMPGVPSLPNMPNFPGMSGMPSREPSGGEKRKKDKRKGKA